jgi:hypothetical protein
MLEWAMVAYRAGVDTRTVFWMSTGVYGRQIFVDPASRLFSAAGGLLMLCPGGERG